jgi:hypothetical protein
MTVNHETARAPTQAISAIRFFFQQVLRREWQLEIHYQRAPQRVPVTLSPEEVVRLLDAVPGLRERAVMEIAYGADLRLNEVLHLKLTDIDSERMILRVEQGQTRLHHNQPQAYNPHTWRNPRFSPTVCFRRRASPMRHLRSPPVRLRKQPYLLNNPICWTDQRRYAMKRRANA